MQTKATTTEFLVRKDHLATTSLRTTSNAPLLEGQVRVAIDHFALTSTNITYAAMGDAMQYWQFFPVADADGAGWGRLPVWGFCTWQARCHPGDGAG